MKGFQNIGNTCYLNSGLQMLIQNKDLCKLIIKYASQSKILNTIAQFINEYYTSSNSSISPDEIKKIVQERQELFYGHQQQDSSEFVVFLLDIIDEEIKKVDENKEGIKPIFGIDFNIRIKCKLKSCLQISNKAEVNNFLLLDINSNSSNYSNSFQENKENKDINDLYRQFKSSDKLEDDNKYLCSRCKVKRIASKRSEIIHWPDHLIIWLKRYKQNGMNIQKNNESIIPNSEWRRGYKLYGGIIHSGGLNGGHYIYIGKNEDDNKWYIYDDSHVSEINEERVESALGRAYWLYYKKN